MIAGLAAIVLATLPADWSAAERADYELQLAAGQQCRYLHARDGAELVELLPALQFAVCATSREAYLPAIVPQPLAGVPIVRLNLTALDWSTRDWATVCGRERNPYTLLGNPLSVPAAWFLREISDQSRSDAYLRLLFGGPTKPKTLREFWAAVGVDPGGQRGLEFGLVEGASRVNLGRVATRLLRFDDGAHVSAWSTFDVRRPRPGADPLAALDKDFAADGSEVFALLPKVAPGLRGVLPATVLANGAGRLVAEAPADLVEDFQRTGGVATIRNPISCWGCHVQGPQRPTENALAARLVAGVQVEADPEQGLAAERFHLAGVDDALDDWAEGYAAALAYVNGLTPEANAAAYVRAVEAYDADLALEDCAAELHCGAETLRLALGWASANEIDIGPRLAGLPHGFDLTRANWETDYQRAVAAVREWRQR